MLDLRGGIPYFRTRVSPGVFEESCSLVLSLVLSINVSVVLRMEFSSIIYFLKKREKERERTADDIVSVIFLSCRHI